MFRTVTVVGVGLIGASLGLAIRQRRLAETIVGVGRRTESLAIAKRRKAIDRGTTSLEEGVAQADLVVICTPVEFVSPSVIATAKAAPAGCLITDAGSVKREIVSLVDRKLGRNHHFVGSHPLAGSHLAGPEHGRANLFEGRTVIVTPSGKSSPVAVEKISQFWSELGAVVQKMTPAEHDKAVASTSHLPHLAASAIASATPSRYVPLVASGWLDTTRVAAGDAGLWQQILLGNRDGVLAALDRLDKELAELRRALESGDAARLERLLAKAKEIRDAVGS